MIFNAYIWNMVLRTLIRQWDTSSQRQLIKDNSSSLSGNMYHNDTNKTYLKNEMLHFSTHTYDTWSYELQSNNETPYHCTRYQEITHLFSQVPCTTLIPIKHTLKMRCRNFQRIHMKHGSTNFNLTMRHFITAPDTKR